MAITQYTQINNRSGLQRDLPQLSTAELGWSVDTRRLYIGNGTLEEGAPEIGNTELLTEYSDIFALAGAYTYKGNQAGYTVSSAPTFAQATWNTSTAALTVVSNTGIFVGQLVIGPGLAPNTIVTAVNGLVISVSAVPIRAAVTAASIVFIGGSITSTGYWTQAYDTQIKVSNTQSIDIGLIVTGSGIPSNSIVTGIGNIGNIYQTINVTANTSSVTVIGANASLIGSGVTVAGNSNIFLSGTVVTGVLGDIVSISPNTNPNAANVTGGNVTFSSANITISNNLGNPPEEPIVITFHSDTTRTLQEKLDDTVSVRDFGAVGDGETDDTVAINIALNQLYCVEPFNTSEPSAPLVRRILLFPAGRYRVTGSLLIPPNCTLSGEGLDHTVIEFDNTIANATGTWSATTNTITANSISGLQVGQIVNGTNITPGSIITGINTNTNVITVNQTQTLAGTNQSLTFRFSSTYVARTASSLQETGTAIDTTAGEAPHDILIRDMSFANPRTTLTSDIFLVERANDVRFERVGFQGAGTAQYISGLVLNQPDQAYSLTYPTKNIQLDACRFTDLSYGIRSAATRRNVTDTYSTTGISITNNKFYDLTQGIYSTSDDFSWIIMNNVMDEISQEGIKFFNDSTETFRSAGQMITTGHNIFLNVGNNNTGLTPIPATHIIYFYNRNCLSVGDMFERDDIQAQTFSRVFLNSQSSIAFQGTESIALGQRILNTSLTSPIAAGVISNIYIPGGNTLLGNSVSDIVFTTQGNGYLPNVTPTVTIGAPSFGGIQATASAIVGRQFSNTIYGNISNTTTPNSSIISGGQGWSGNVLLVFTPPTIVETATLSTFNGSWANGNSAITLVDTSPNVEVGGIISAAGIPLNVKVGNVSGNIISAVYTTNNEPVLTWIAPGVNLPVTFGYGVLYGQGARSAAANAQVAFGVTDFVVANIGRGYPSNVSVTVAETSLGNITNQLFANCTANVILKGFGLELTQGNIGNSWANSTLTIGEGYTANSNVTILFPAPQAGNGSTELSVQGFWTSGANFMTLNQSYTGIAEGGNIDGITGISGNVVVGSIIYSSYGDIIYPLYTSNSSQVVFPSNGTNVALDIVRTVSVANGFITATANAVVAYGVDDGIITNSGNGYSLANNTANLYTVTFTEGVYTNRSYLPRAKPYLGFPLLPDPAGVTLVSGGNRYASMPEALLTPLLPGPNVANADIRVYANVLGYEIVDRGNGYSINDILDIPATGANVAANANARVQVANIYASVSNITVVTPGTGYTSVPGLTFAAPNLANADTATATATAIAVSATPVNRGTNYNGGDLVTVIAGGTGASASLSVNSTRISNISLTSTVGANLFVGNVLTLIGGTPNPAAEVTVTRLQFATNNTLSTIANAGNGYNVGNTIWFGDPGYSNIGNILITAVDGVGGISQFIITESGNFATSFIGNASTMIFGGNNNGTGAVINFSFGIRNFSLTNSGNYAVNTVASNVPGNTATGGLPEEPRFNVVYEINSFSVANGGNYTTGPLTTTNLTLTTSTGSGTGASADVAYGVGHLTLTSGGNGYYANNPPVITTSGGGNGNVIANLNITGWIANSNLLFGGQYTNFPANIANTPLTPNTIANTSIINNTANVNVFMGIESLVVINQGQGYQVAPVISFTGYDANTTNANAFTTIANVGGIVVDIDLRSSTVGNFPPPQGAGYLTPPTFTVSGPNVANATGNTTLTTVGNVFFNFTNIGSGYSIPYDGGSANNIGSNAVITVVGPGTGGNLYQVSETANSYSVISVGVNYDGNVLHTGNGYLAPPAVTAQPSNWPNISNVAVIYSQLASTGQLANLRFIDRGYGYTQMPQVTIATDGAYGNGVNLALSLETYGNVFLTGITGGSGYSNAPVVTFSAPSSNLYATAVGTAVVGEYQQPLVIDTRVNPSTVVNYMVRITDGGNVYTRSGALNITGGQTYISNVSSVIVQSDDEFVETYNSGFQLTVTNAPGNAYAVIGYDNSIANSTIGNGAGTMKFYIDEIVNNN